MLKRYKRSIRGFFLILLLGSVSGCASYKLDTFQRNLRNSFATQQRDAKTDLIEKLNDPRIYQPKDQVLKQLESGTVYHFSGDYKESFHAYQEAELAIEESYTQSVSNAAKSILINDNELVYDGEDYENIYLSAFKALNFIHMENLEGAQVEARKMSFKLEQLSDKYEGVANSLEQHKYADQVEIKRGKASIQNSAMARYLSAILYAKNGNYDDARIEYNKLESALAEQRANVEGYVSDFEEFPPLHEGNYNALIVAFSGRSPYKTANTTRVYSDEHDIYMKISLPELNLYKSNVAGVRYRIEGQKTGRLMLVEQMDQVARQIFQIKKPIIYARTFLRSLVKTVAGKAINDEVDEKNNKVLSFLTEVATTVATEASEKADLRSWQTMPGTMHAATLSLPPGEHELIVEYLDYRGRILSEQTRTITINPDVRLSLMETLYWN